MLASQMLFRIVINAGTSLTMTTVAGSVSMEELMATKDVAGIKTMAMTNKGDIAGLQSDLTGVTTRVGKTETDLGTLSTSLESVKSTLSTLNAEVCVRCTLCLTPIQEKFNEWKLLMRQDSTIGSPDNTFRSGSSHGWFA